MNNSVQLPPEEGPDVREKAGRLTTLIECISAILESPEWSTLKEAEFDRELERLERVLLTEAKKQELNRPEIYRLQGRIEAMKRFDLAHLRDKYLAEYQTVTRI